MAHRDRSQGFGFVYGEIAEMLANHRKATLEEKPTAIPESAPVVNVPNKEVTPAKNPSLKQIQDNLDRIQQLHHKLHAMLEELNQISDRRKKRSEE